MRQLAVFSLLTVAAVRVTAAPVDFAADPEAAFQGLDFASVFAQRDAMLAVHPDDPLVLGLVGRAWIEGAPTPDAAQAIDLCQRGLALGGDEWKQAECHLGIALAEWSRGNTAAAAEACRRAAEISPRSRARREADLVRACLDMMSVITPHLWVFAPRQSQVAGDLQAWAERREQAAAAVVTTLGIQPWRRVRVVVCDSEAQGQQVLGHGLSYTDRPLVTVFTRAEQTPGHEITHALSTFLMPGHPWGGGPNVEAGRGRLINEGLAVSLDDSGRDAQAEARAVLARLGTQPTFAMMDQESTPEDTLYPLAGGFIAWLGQTHGAPAFVQFWCHPGTSDEASRAVYGVPLETLWSQWRSSLGIRSAP